MSSKEDICNRCLQKLGCSSIQTLGDNKTEARECRLAFFPTYLSLLRIRRWRFALHDILITCSKQPKSSGNYVFRLPQDCVTPLNIGGNVLYRGRELLLPWSEPFNLHCVWFIKNLDTLDPLFEELFATKLAEVLAVKLTNSESRKTMLLREYGQLLIDASKAGLFEQAPVGKYGGYSF